VPPGVARAVLEGPDSLLGRRLLGEDPIAPEHLTRRLYGELLHSNRRGWAIVCLGAVDVALWDLFGKALGRPVYQLLGGAERARAQCWDLAEEAPDAAGGGPRDRYTAGEVVPYATVVSTGWDAAGVLREQVERAARLCDLGYRAVKVEPMRSAPETVVELARRTREAIGPRRMLAVDVGYLWNDVGLALRVAEGLLAADVFFLETPFPVDSLGAYAELAAKTRLRVAAGEHSVTRWEFLDLLDRGGVRVVQPYATTAGGLSEARHVVDLAQARGALVCPGNWSTQVLGAANVHLAAYSPVTPYVEYAPAEIYWSPLRRAIQQVGLPVAGGAIALPAAPGVGVDLPADLIRHFRID
jgi:L-alanine-DL-glutamate epimerase-like enolase superfamily enzyme